MALLLDTNVWIDYLKNPGGAAEQRLRALRPPEIVSCSVVRAELLRGAEKYGNSERRRRKVEELLAPFVSLAFDDPAAAAYAVLTHDLERRGLTIGPFDRQIAAIALVGGLRLGTANISEFGRVPGLRVEDWSR